MKLFILLAVLINQVVIAQSHFMPEEKVIKGQEDWSDGEKSMGMTWEQYKDGEERALGGMLFEEYEDLKTQYSQNKLSLEKQKELERATRNLNAYRGPINDKKLAYRKKELTKLKNYRNEQTKEWNELKWKLSDKLPNAMKNANNISPKDKKLADELNKKKSYVTGRYNRLHYLEKLKEKNDGKLPNTLAKEFEYEQKNQKEKVKNEINRLKKMESKGKISDLNKARLKALLKSGSLEHSSLVLRNLEKDSELSKDEKEYLKMYEDGKNSKEVYDKAWLDFDKLEKKEGKRLYNLSKQMTFDPEYLNNMEKNIINNYEEQNRLTCGHAGPCPKAAFKDFKEENARRIEDNKEKVNSINGCLVSPSKTTCYDESDGVTYEIQAQGLPSAQRLGKGFGKINTPVGESDNSGNLIKSE